MRKDIVDDIVENFLKFDTDDGYKLYDKNNDYIETFASEEDARRFIEDNEEYWLISQQEIV